MIIIIIQIINVSKFPNPKGSKVLNPKGSEVFNPKVAKVPNGSKNSQHGYNNN